MDTTAGMAAKLHRAGERSLSPSGAAGSNASDPAAEVVPDKVLATPPGSPTIAASGQVPADKPRQAIVAPIRGPRPSRLAQNLGAEGRKPRSGAATTTSTSGDSGGPELLKQARERWDTDDVDGALVLAKQAAAAGGGADAHVLIGTVLLKKKQRREAEREFEEALRLNPENGKASKLLQLARGGASTGN